MQKRMLPLSAFTCPKKGVAHPWDTPVQAIQTKDSHSCVGDILSVEDICVPLGPNAKNANVLFTRLSL